MVMTKKSYVNIGKFLKASREKAGLSQREVAEHLGYTTAQFVSNWERGLITPPVATMSVLLGLYKMSKKELTDLLIAEYKYSLGESLGKK